MVSLHIEISVAQEDDHLGVVTEDVASVGRSERYWRHHKGRVDSSYDCPSASADNEAGEETKCHQFWSRHPPH